MKNNVELNLYQNHSDYDKLQEILRQENQVFRTKTKFSKADGWEKH